MKKSILFLCVFIMCLLVMKAENRPVIIHNNGWQDHGGFIMADMPDAVY